MRGWLRSSSIERYRPERPQRVQPQQVREGLPFQDARVDLDLVAGQLVARLAAVGEAEMRFEAPLADRLDGDLRDRLFVRQRAIAVQAAGERRAGHSDGEQQRAGQAAQHEAAEAQAGERAQPGEDRGEADDREGGGEQPEGVDGAGDVEAGHERRRMESRISIAPAGVGGSETRVRCPRVARLRRSYVGITSVGYDL